jgi:tRNA threonylcarbamoyladenosine biosynthesis protein TsaB
MTEPGSGDAAAAADPTILAFDATGSTCSVAVGVGGHIIADERQIMRHGHAEALLPMVDRVMRRAALAPDALKVVATAVGPGGFTGIRTALAAAHGIALGAGAALVGVTGFDAVVAALAHEPEYGLLVALDSRREDLYVQCFDCARRALAAPQAVMPAALSRLVQAIWGEAPLLIAGDAGERAAAILGERLAVALAANSSPDAVGVHAAALSRRRGGGPHGPMRALYLRSPDVTRPRGPGGGGNA